MQDPIYKFHVDRMLFCGLGRDYWEDPWGVGFSMDMVENAKEKSTPYNGKERSAKWHAGRVKYLANHPELLDDPISVDCECMNNRVLPMPIIIDGWHRFFAHLVIGKKTIRATFGGLEDVREFLDGTIDFLPNLIQW